MRWPLFNPYSVLQEAVAGIAVGHYFLLSCEFKELSLSSLFLGLRLPVQAGEIPSGCMLLWEGTSVRVA